MREDWIEAELGELSLLELGGDWGKDPKIEDVEYLEAYCIRGSEFRNWENDKGKTASLRKIKKDSIQTVMHSTNKRKPPKTYQFEKYNQTLFLFLFIKSLQGDAMPTICKEVWIARLRQCLQLLPQLHIRARHVPSVLNIVFSRIMDTGSCFSTLRWTDNKEHFLFASQQAQIFNRVQRLSLSFSVGSISIFKG
jgi:hypothetical protein